VKSMCQLHQLSVCVEQLGSHQMDFHEIWYFFFENLSCKFKFHYNTKRITGTLHEDVCTFMIISQIIHGVRNVSDKIYK
jgi:hypothetical protein